MTKRLSPVSGGKVLLITERLFARKDRKGRGVSERKKGGLTLNEKGEYLASRKMKRKNSGDSFSASFRQLGGGSQIHQKGEKGSNLERIIGLHRRKSSSLDGPRKSMEGGGRKGSLLHPKKKNSSFEGGEGHPCLRGGRGTYG